MYFEIVGSISEVSVIARGTGVRKRAQLKKKYGGSRWRKMKGIARIRLEGGIVHTAELHWYEAHGIGKKQFKIKYLLD